MKTQSPLSWIGIEGALMALSPLPVLFSFLGVDTAFPHTWRLITASLSSIACFTSALIIFRQPGRGKFLGAMASAGSYAVAFPYIARNPFAALMASVAFIYIVFVLVDSRVTNRIGTKSDNAQLYQQRAWWAAIVVPLIVIFGAILGTSETFSAVAVITFSSITAQILFLRWAIEKKSKIRPLIPVVGFASICAAFLLSSPNIIPVVAVLISLFSLIALPRNRVTHDKAEHWWEILLNHPARIMLTAFLSLCILGTLLLILPSSTKAGAIHLIDAIFTSVSAVCVTGLIVLDTPKDFTFFGQLSILFLIQLGGLGIMSITAVALHAIGRRLSLRQERLLTSMTDTDHKDLFHSLTTILKFTLFSEMTGSLLLTILFYLKGDAFAQALWRGIFTAISAFCNAGFALQSESMIPYQSNPYILHIVSILIIFGGMAPATSLIVPRWLAGKPVQIPARIALATTAILLVAGTFFIMAFEWNGILADLSFTDKIQNAWFQSVTLRTAGFNSVNVASVASPTFFVMISFMFIGGSPGGTAGGVKTTTIGLLAMTFWANIRNRGEIVTRNRRVHSATVYRAITIVASGMIVWFLVVLMLEVTQQISARDLIFETTSALGTVGLSTGATPLLDEIGKVIVVIAMFVGRIGPMTLFMLLSDEQTASISRCPYAKISLT